MAKCETCEREMKTANGCVERFYCLSNGNKVKAVKAGQDGWVEPGGRCGDCGAEYGEYHHLGCDVERCGKCGGQFISCDCDYTDDMYIIK